MTSVGFSLTGLRICYDKGWAAVMCRTLPTMLLSTGTCHLSTQKAEAGGSWVTSKPTWYRVNPLKNLKALTVFSLHALPAQKQEVEILGEFIIWNQKSSRLQFTLCVWAFCLCAYPCTCVQSWSEQSRGVGFPGAGVIGSSPMWMLGTKLASPESSKRS